MGVPGLGSIEPERDLIRAAARNFMASYRVLVRHVGGAADRRFGAVYAFATGLPISMFNGVIVDEPPDAGDVQAALDWVAAAAAPYVLSVPEALAESLARLARDRDLAAADWHVPHMVMSPPRNPPVPAGGVGILPVTDPATARVFRAAMAADGTPAASVERLIPDSFLDDPDVLAFVGTLDGAPAGTSVAIRSGDVAGVYAVGTAPAARRRGVGTATTWASVGAARRWGCSSVVLQSSRMGFGVYQAMGFRTVTRIVSFTAR